MTQELTARDRLIVALDTDAREAVGLARSLEDTVRWLKIGMTLFYAAGPDIVRQLRELGFDVFLDLKLHDIPHQARGAAESVARLGVQMLTVHASGGSTMVEAAVEGAASGAREAGVQPPAILGVTVLTSMNDVMLSAVGVGRSADEQVPLLARVAHAGGAQGVVCSPHEAQDVRALLGHHGLVVTPGVRPAWADAGDQARIATPSHALHAGASHLVVGRPITAAARPAEAALNVLAEMEEALEWRTT